MKTCAIRDEAAEHRIIGYLLYYERSGMFFIELSPEMTEADATIFFASFIRRGIWTVDPQWSTRWVQQRIIPTDRQNLGTILRENKLKEYNEFRLLMLGDGRCAQDDCAVFPVKEEQLSDWIFERRKRKLEFAAALKEKNLFLVFRDGSVRIANVEKELQRDRKLQILLSRQNLFYNAELLPGGNGVSWGEGMFLMTDKLYKCGKKLPIDKEEFRMLLKSSVLNTAEVCEELQCSRQYVNQLVQKRELICLKESGNNRLYERGEIERLKGV